jgi:hypothetical protein
MFQKTEMDFHHVFSLQILSSDKNFVCRTLQANNNDKLILKSLVLYYY